MYPKYPRVNLGLGSFKQVRGQFGSSGSIREVGVWVGIKYKYPTVTFEEVGVY